MKNLISLLVFLLIYKLIIGQSSDSLAVETTLEEIITIGNSIVTENESSSGVLFDRLAPYILYSGNDAIRKHKDACDYNITSDRNQVDIIGKKLVAWLETIIEFKVIKYGYQKKGNSEWHYITVLGKTTKMEEKKVFIFVKVKDRFLIENIE